MARALPGDSLWAFTRRTHDGLYILAAELVIRAVTRNPPNYRYGIYRAWGDLARSRYFDVELGPSAELTEVVTEDGRPFEAEQTTAGTPAGRLSCPS